jgi:Ca-activated chloride channel family protein
MRVIRALVFTIIGLTLCALAGAEEREDRPGQPTFRSTVDVVALSVTVLDAQQHLVGHLGREAFAVFEDGVQQQLTYFEASDVPLDLAILIDASVSMSPKLPFVARAAAGLTTLLRPQDRAAVLAFNDHVRVLTPFTADVAAVTSAIDGVRAQGGTALYNAVYVALREFSRQRRAHEPVRRRAIVVLTDGEDTASVIDFEGLLAEARMAGVTIYTIGLRTPDPLLGPSGARPRFSQADWAIKALAQETGATVHFPTRTEEVQAAYADIGRELGQQYALGYISSNPVRNGAFRRVVVRIADRPDMRSRTRPGYVAGTAPALALAR